MLHAAITVQVEKGMPQLFVDDLLIESGDGLVRTLHQPVKDDGGNKPVIATGLMFGDHKSTLEANGTILYDPRLKKYVMYAHPFVSSLDRDEPDGWQRIHVLRYTSSDAMNWIAGDDGNLDQIFPRSREDLYDPHSGTYATYIGMTSFYYDLEDPAFPYKAWFWFANWGEGREGIYYMRSTDGRFWERGRQILSNMSYTIAQGRNNLTGPGDVTFFYPDPLTDRFLALVKFYQLDMDKATGNLFRSRAYLFVDRLDEPIDMKRFDHVELVPPGSKSGGDEPFDEYYAANAWRYGSQWLGILKVWHGRGDYPHSAAGAGYFKFISSRDGLDWEKVRFMNDDGVPEVFLPNGKEGGNNGLNDGGYMTGFSNGPLRIGDELIFYYASSSYGKNHPDDIRITGGGIFRARLRVDGFVSVDAGTFTTPVLQIDGDELLVNSKGTVEIALLNSNGKQLGIEKVTGDSIRHNVRFSGRPAGKLTDSNEIRLRFTMEKGSELYSFRVE